MEAFTDGQKHTTASSIVTYLEGELLDFNTHTFKTINFSSSPTCDASNWRKLEPFVHMTNQQMVASLASRKFMKDLMDNWVFMRWKGSDGALLSLCASIYGYNAAG